MQRKELSGWDYSQLTSKPIDIQVPDQLLVAADNVELRDGEIVIKDPSIYPDGYADWFLRYQNEYSWGEEGRQTYWISKTG